MTSGSGASEAEHLFERYLAYHGSADTDGVVTLFSEDATLEDPVGAPVLSGRAAIHDFFRATHARQGRLAFERVGSLLVRGVELAVHVRARLERDLAGSWTDVIYTFRLDGDGRIRALRAYF